MDRGIAVTGIRNATHLGRIGEWAERAADAGVIFLAFVNHGGGSKLVAPPGSTVRRYGTNPVAIGIPSFGAVDFPIVLDIATSQVAHGKITKRAVEGKDLPENWAIGPEGKPLTDAVGFENGLGGLLPLGGMTAGYKGFGLAMMVELCAGIIGNSRVIGQEVPSGDNNAAAFVAIDPEMFSTPQEIHDKIKAIHSYVRETEYSAGVSPGIAAYGDEALLPGEREHNLSIDRRENGIPYDRKTIHLLNELASQVSIDETHHL